MFPVQDRVRDPAASAPPTRARVDLPEAPRAAETEAAAASHPEPERTRTWLAADSRGRPRRSFRLLSTPPTIHMRPVNITDRQAVAKEHQISGKRLPRVLSCRIQPCQTGSHIFSSFFNT